MTEGKVAIVTGASRGIGAALQEAYLSHGYRVLAVSRHIEPSRSEDLVAAPVDLSRAGSAEEVVELALRSFGRIDSLVNNAGRFLSMSFEDYSSEELADIMALNLSATFRLTQHVVRTILGQGKGHVAFITTSLVDQPMRAVPSALAALTKGGLDALARSLAIEFADRGIRFNAVSPGIIDTPMHRPETHPFFRQLHPMGRMGRASEIADAVLYLERAEFVTGETLHVDGGAHAGHW
jgi:NAD(P)-dependent dehydrogenase (short-subunit alcohol dehydrogenase family)